MNNTITPTNNVLKLHCTRVLVALLTFQLAFQPMTALAENFKLEGGGNHAPSTSRPFVDGANNGVPVVNINTPNSQGLSHNTYQHFNVSPSGVVLNNNATNVNSQQAGWIGGNPNLRTGNEARIILNEVIGASRSQLNGYIEVAGKKANVIVANPNGVTCNGCGFVNTDRVILTTGAAQFNNDGSLNAFRTTTGDIQILGNGLDGSGQQRVDILGQAVKVYGKIKVQGKLNVVTGNNSIDYLNGQVTKNSETAEDGSIGLDVSNLGGMYANQINLQVIDKGAGVNMQAGELIAIDQIFLSADGEVAIAGGRIESSQADIIINANKLSINADENDTTSQWLAKQDIVISTQADTSLNKVSFASEKNISISQTKSELAANSHVLHIKNSQLEAKGNLNITADKLIISNQSALIAEIKLQLQGIDIELTDSALVVHTDSVNSNYGDLLISAEKSFSMTGGSITAANNLDLQASYIEIKNARVAALHNLTLNGVGSLAADIVKAGQITIEDSYVIAAAGDLKLFANTVEIKGTYELDINNLEIRDANGNAKSKSQLWAGNNIEIQSSTFTNTNGLLWAANDLQIDLDGQGTRAERISNQQGTLVVANGDVTLAADLVENTGQKPTFIVDGINETWTDLAGVSATDVIGDTYKLIDAQYLTNGKVDSTNNAAYLDLLISLMEGTPLTTAAKNLLKDSVIDGDKVKSELRNSWNLLKTKATAQSIADLDTYLKGLLATTIEKEIAGVTQEITVSLASGLNPLILDDYLALWEAVINGGTIPTNSLSLIKAENKTDEQLISSVNTKFVNMRASTNVPYEIKYFLKADKLNLDGFLGRIIAGNDINIDSDRFKNIHANLAAGNDITITADSEMVNQSFAASKVIVEVHKKACFTCHEGKQGYGDSFGGKLQAKNNFLLNVAIGNLSSTVEESSNGDSKIADLVVAVNQDTSATRDQLDETHDNRSDEAAVITAKQDSVDSLGTRQTEVSADTRVDNATVINGENTSVKIVTTDGVVINIPRSLIGVIEDKIDTSEVPLSEAQLYPRELNLNYTDYLTFLSSAFTAGRLGNHRELRDAAFGDGFPSPGQLADGFDNTLGDGWSNRNTAIANENALTREEWLQRTQRAMRKIQQQIKIETFISGALVSIMDKGAINTQNSLHQGGALIAAQQINLNVKGDINLQGEVNAEQQLTIATQGDLNSEAQLTATNQLTIDAENIKQTGGAIKAKNVILKSQQDTDIIASNIAAEQNLSIEAGNDISIGSQLNKSTGIRAGKRWNSEKRIASEINAGGDISLTSGQDVNIKGSSVTAQQAIDVTAGRDINILSETEKRDYSYTQTTEKILTEQSPTVKSRDTAVVSTITKTTVNATELAQAKSILNSGADITLNAGRDLNISASDLVTDSNIVAHADGEINISSAITERNEAKAVSKATVVKPAYRANTGKYRDRDVVFSEENQLNEHKKIQVASHLDALGNIQLSSGTDTTINASQLNAGGYIAIKAADDINITAENNQINTYTKIGNTTQANQDTVAAVSELKSIGNLILESGADVNLEGTVLAAIEKLEVTAAGNINVAAVKQQHNQQQRTTGSYTENRRRRDDDYTVTIETSNSKNSQLTDYKGASLKGDGVSISSGKSITATAANIVSDDKLTLSAGDDVNLEAAQGTSQTQTDNTGGSKGFLGGRGAAKVQTNTTFQQGTTLESTGDTEITALQDINVASSTIRAKQDINIAAANNIIITSERESSSTKKAYRNTYNNNMTQSGSEISADGSTLLYAQQNIGVEGSLIDAKETTKLQADENIVISSAEEFRTSGYSYKKKSGFMGHRKKSIKHSEQYLTHKAATLSGDEGVEISSGANTQIVASDVISSKSDINIATGGELLQLAQLDKTRIQHSKKKSSAWGLVKKNHTLDKVNHSANGSISEAMGNVALRSGGSTRLQASEFKAASVNITAGIDTQGQVINPNAKIYLDSITEFSSLRESIFDSSGLKYISIDKGFEKTQEAQTKISADTIALKAAAGIDASVGVAPEGSLEQAMDKLVAEPGMEWLKELKQRDDVNWQAVETEFNDWHYEQSGLSALASLIIAIAVGVAMGPMGAGYVGGSGGVGAAAAAGGGSIGTAVGSGALGIALEAGTVSLATTASISLINNKGDIGAVFKELGSSANVKSLITSMVTAGVVNKAGLSKLTNVDASFTDHLKGAIYTSAIETSAKVAINGGSFKDSFKDSLKGSFLSNLVDVAGKNVTKLIGDQEHTDTGGLGWKQAGVEKTLAHALVGCVTSAAKGGDCKAGAIGAAVAEQLSPYLEDNSENKEWEIELTNQLSLALISAGAAAIAGGSDEELVDAANSAKQTDNYNRKLHLDEIQAIKEKAKQLSVLHPEKTEVEWIEALGMEALRRTDKLHRIQNKVTLDPLVVKSLDELAFKHGTAFSKKVAGQFNFLGQDAYYENSATFAGNILTNREFYDDVFASAVPENNLGFTGSDVALIHSMANVGIKTYGFNDNTFDADDFQILDPSDEKSDLDNMLTLKMLGNELNQTLKKSRVIDRLAKKEYFTLKNQRESDPNTVTQQQVESAYDKWGVTGNIVRIASKGQKVVTFEIGALLNKGIRGGAANAVGKIAEDTLRLLAGVPFAVTLLASAAAGDESSRAEVNQALAAVADVLQNLDKLPQQTADAIMADLERAEAAYNNGELEKAGEIVGQLQAEMISAAGAVGGAAKGLSSGLQYFAKKVNKPNADKYGSELATNCSFAGNTQVLTSNGYIQISQLREGESVWSRNSNNGQMGWKTVLAQYSNPYKYTVNVSIADRQSGEIQTITSNRIHPFFVQTVEKVAKNSEEHDYQGPIANGQWVDASELKAGYKLLNDDQSWSEVVSISVETKSFTAYNLTVDDYHTYFVKGESSREVRPVWVHNDCWDSKPDSAEGLTDTKDPISTNLSQPGGLNATEGDRVVKPNGKLTKPTHPLAKHGPDVTDEYLITRVETELLKGKRPREGFRTKFNDRAQMEEAINNVVETRKVDIDDWLTSNPNPGSLMSFSASSKIDNLGKGFQSVKQADGSFKIEPITRPLNEVNLVLKSDGAGGYLIHTAHPQ